MPGTVELAWTGEIDLATVDAHRAEVEQLIDTGLADALSLDLAGVTFIDSTGLALLVHLRDCCFRAYVDLSLRGVTPTLRQLLTVTGLLPLFVIDYVHPDTGVDPARLPRHAPLPARSDPTFDRIAQLAARLSDVPTAAVSLVDRDGQVFPGAVGMRKSMQTLRASLLSHSLCQHVVARAAELVVPDLAADPLFAESDAALDLRIAAYAGVPITRADGKVVGSLCAINDTPTDWTEDHLANLRLVAELASAELQNRESADRASDAVESIRAAHVGVTHHLLAAGLVLTRGLAASNGTVAHDIRQAVEHTEAALAELRASTQPAPGP